MTRRSTVLRVAVAVIAVLLAGATAFGAWHVVVGGLLNANPRAGAFGAVLAIGAGSLLVAVTIGARRLSARDSSAPHR